MAKNQRQSDRFNDFGRVESSALSLIPGVLTDISITGCKVRFPISLTLDMDADYPLKIRTSRKNESSPLSLIGHPQWVKNEDGSTVIGFSFLHSPDTARLKFYIQQLSDEKFETENVDRIVTEDVCQFV